MGNYTESAERFAADAKNHQMTVLHDDDVYRHLRCQAPDSSFYWFDIITWPGKLTFAGDGRAFVFSRLPDMFEFFRMNHGSINPTYWSEKLVSNPGDARAYSMDKFNEQVADELAEAEKTYPGVTAAWAERVEFDYNTEHEVLARQALDDFEYLPEDADDDVKPFRFADTWEWDFQDWDWWFLWACQGIKWAIGQYDALKASKVAEVASL